MASSKRRPRLDMSLEGATQALTEGYMFSSPERMDQDNAAMIRPGNMGVQGYIEAEWYKQLRDDPRFEETLLLLPGHAPWHYLHRKGLEWAVKYAINLSYVNRPDDPIEF